MSGRGSARTHAVVIASGFFAAFLGIAIVHSPAMTMFAALLLAISALVVWRREARVALGTGSVGASRVVGMWWMNPAILVGLAALPSLLIAWQTNEFTYQEDWGTPKYFDAGYATAGALMVLSLAVGAWLAVYRRRRRVDAVVTISEVQQTVLLRAAYWTFFLTLAGYIAWLAFAFQRGLTGSALFDILTGSGQVLRVRDEYLAPVAGVTTLSQLAPIAACSFFVLGRLGVMNATPYLTTLIAVATGRAIFNAERLAVVEVVLPLLVLWIAIPATPYARRIWSRAWRHMIPVWIPVAVLVLFGSTEYMRTWSTHYRDASGDTYSTFVLKRLGAYYATGFNNAALLDQHGDDTSPVPYYILRFVWDFPVVSEVLSYERATGTSPTATDLPEQLERRANPEFNNPGGLLTPMVDGGLLTALLFWFGAGIALGAVYLRFRNGSVGAVILYPTLIVGALEVPRILWWTEGRTFPTLLAGGIIVLALMNAGRRQTQRERAGAERGLPQSAGAVSK